MSKSQYCCDGGDGCCGNTSFEVFDKEYDILELICTRCGHSMTIEADVELSVH